MDEDQKMILALTEQAIREWTDGTAEVMFPVTDETRECRANMLWNMAANAIAYGLAKGIEAGLKMAKEGAA